MTMSAERYTPARARAQKNKENNNVKNKGNYNNADGELHTNKESKGKSTNNKAPIGGAQGEHCHL